MAQYKDTLHLVDKVTKPLLKISQGFKKLDDRIGKTTERLEKFKKRTENIGKLGNKIKSVGQGLTLGVTLPVVAMGGAMIKAAADIEAMQQQLSTMLGSAEAGGKMFEEIKTMAAKTPFETKDLMAATNTMLGFGIAQEKVLPLMNQLGDISGGNAQRFQSLALAFSQVSSAGKLQGQDLLQMINAGFNPLESIAKRTGKSVGYWKDQMSKGKVSVAMVEQAMKDATSEGGRFFGMMDKQSKTALGQWSTFQDNLNMLLAEFGKIILPTAIKGLQKLSSMLEWFNSLSTGTKKTILIFAGVLALIGPMISIVGALTVAIAGLNTAMLFLAANPIALAIAGIVAAIAGLIKLIDVLIKKLRLVRQGLNLKNADSLAVLSKEHAEIGTKEFKKKYGSGAVKAVEKYNSTNNTTNNTNNTTNNVTNNNYYAGANPKNAKYNVAN